MRVWENDKGQRNNYYNKVAKKVLSGTKLVSNSSKGHPKLFMSGGWDVIQGNVFSKWLLTWSGVPAWITERHYY